MIQNSVEVEQDAVTRTICSFVTEIPRMICIDSTYLSFALLIISITEGMQFFKCTCMM